MKTNIVLCGFMGCGKTTVGNALKKATGFPLYDTDLEIEHSEGRSISDIFSTFGEPYFRATEQKVIKELSLKNNIIIATGGGAVMNSENAKTLKSTGLVVFLDVTAETVIKRLKDDTTRPLLMREDKETAVRELLESRRPVYEAVCDIKIDANGDAEEIVAEMLKFYNR